MSDIKIDTCPICGGHSFSPLAAGQYMCTQCGYVVNDGSDSSQAPSSSSSSSSDSLQESPLSTEEEPSPEVNMDQTRCPRCGSVVDKGVNFCPKCGFRFSQEESSTTETAEEGQSPVYDEDEQEHGLFYKLLKWVGIVIGVLFGGSWALFLVVGLVVEFCSTGKDSAMEDSVSVDSTETKVAASTWEKITFDGVMYDEEGNLGNMQVTYETDGTNVRNCICKNVDLGGKIKMNLEITHDTYSFSGKDGKNKFEFILGKDELMGPGRDGKKGLLVMMHKEGKNPEDPPAPVEMSLWSYGPDFPGDIDVKGQIGCYKNGADKYILRVVSYDKGSGRCVLEAYLRGKTIGKFIGNYSTDSFVDDEGYDHYTASYNGMFHYTDGRQKEFQFFID